jgi:hypothetical protein
MSWCPYCYLTYGFVPVRFVVDGHVGPLVWWPCPACREAA